MNNDERSFLQFINFLDNPDKYKAKFDAIVREREQLTQDMKLAHAEQAQAISAKQDLIKVKNEYAPMKAELMSLVSDADKKDKAAEIKLDRVSAAKKEVSQERKNLKSLIIELEARDVAIAKVERDLIKREDSIKKRLKSVTEKEAKLKDYFK